MVDMNSRCFFSSSSWATLCSDDCQRQAVLSGGRRQKGGRQEGGRQGADLELLLGAGELVPEPGVLLAEAADLGLELLLLRLHHLEMARQRHHHLHPFFPPFTFLLPPCSCWDLWTWASSIPSWMVSRERSTMAAFSSISDASSFPSLSADRDAVSVVCKALLRCLGTGGGEAGEGDLNGGVLGLEGLEPLDDRLGVLEDLILRQRRHPPDVLDLTPAKSPLFVATSPPCPLAQLGSGDTHKSMETPLSSAGRLIATNGQNKRANVAGEMGEGRA